MNSTTIPSGLKVLAVNFRDLNIRTSNDSSLNSAASLTLGLIDWEAYLRGLQIYQDIQVAGVAILVLFDTLLTLTDEVDLIWRRRWNLSTILYILTRYIAFVDTAISTYQWTGFNDTALACNVTSKMIPYFYLAAYCIAQIILILRTYALCNRDKRILAGIICSDLACMAGAGYYVARFSASIQDPISAYQNIHLPCGFHLDPGVGVDREVGLWIAYLFLLIAETILMIVTAAYMLYSRGYGAHRLPGSQLLRTIYRDGFSFYVFLQAFSLINVIVLNVSLTVLKDSFVSIHRILHALFTARILLNIRQVASAPSSELSLSGFEAAPRIAMSLQASDPRNVTYSTIYELHLAENEGGSLGACPGE